MSEESQTLSVLHNTSWESPLGYYKKEVPQVIVTLDTQEETQEKDGENATLHNACWEEPKGDGISDGRMSKDTLVKWGNVFGILADQLDLMAVLGGKQDKVITDSDGNDITIEVAIANLRNQLTTIENKIDTKGNIEDLLPLIYAGL